LQTISEIIEKLLEDHDIEKMPRKTAGPLCFTIRAGKTIPANVTSYVNYFEKVREMFQDENHEYFLSRW
jgi:hypothetical protein